MNHKEQGKKWIRFDVHLTNNSKKVGHRIIKRFHKFIGFDEKYRIRKHQKELFWKDDIIRSISYFQCLTIRRFSFRYFLPHFLCWKKKDCLLSKSSHRKRMEKTKRVHCLDLINTHIIFSHLFLSSFSTNSSNWYHDWFQQWNFFINTETNQIHGWVASRSWSCAD